MTVYAPHLLDYDQQDCQEFLRFLLDGLSEDLFQPMVILPSVPTNSNTASDELQTSRSPPKLDAGGSASESNSTQETSSEMSFVGKIRSTIKGISFLYNSSDMLIRCNRCYVNPTKHIDTK